MNSLLRQFRSVGTKLNTRKFSQTPALYKGRDAPKDLKVCVVGGGHASQTCAALFPWKGISTKVFAGYGNEAEVMNAGIKEQGGIICNFASHNEPSGEIKGKPEIITKDPSVVADCNVIILPLPSFAYKDVLHQIKPHIKPGTFLTATPGQGGFDYIAKDILGPVSKDITIFSITPMPFNCRIKESGKYINVQQFEKHYQVCSNPQQDLDACISINNRLFGRTEGLGHFLTCTLQPLNPNIHPQHMFTLLKNWKEGDTFDEPPLFYETMSPEDNVLMMGTSEEVQKIAAVLRTRLCIDCNPYTIWESECEENPVPEFTVDKLFRTSPAYKGFRAPFKKLPSGKWAPDFNNRYYTEDIPFGLCVWKGLAELTGIETPVIDKILYWAQARMGKEYLVNGKLVGKDVKETSAPQVHGITDIKQLY